ncbi:hypothetical protein NPIL_253711 [Nephila pilipes]|uniref:Uncharacterized protein n=1 Tax=Nephila pilipes TaxID=299642 RepID=A0A8X6T7F8_NEPPI|nr:hypothetical protein NPIL_253711 [Nephila pilipes]
MGWLKAGHDEQRLSVFIQSLARYRGVDRRKIPDSCFASWKGGRGIEGNGVSPGDALRRFPQTMTSDSGTSRWCMYSGDDSGCTWQINGQGTCRGQPVKSYFPVRWVRGPLASWRRSTMRSEEDIAESGWTSKGRADGLGASGFESPDSTTNRQLRSATNMKSLIGWAGLSIIRCSCRYWTDVVEVQRAPGVSVCEG